MKYQLPSITTRQSIRARLARMSQSSKISSDGRGCFLGDGLPRSTAEEIRTHDIIAMIDALDRQEVHDHIQQFETALLGVGGVQVIMRQLGLEDWLKYFVANNLTHQLPYHNQYHSYQMVLNCYEGGMYEEEQLGTSQIRGLLVGALMHDYNHSGGKLPDSTNINVALQGLCEGHHALPNILSESEYTTAVNCIKATEYPYVVAPMNIPELIIRDADLMTVYDTDFTRLKSQYVGLWQEVKINSPMECSTFLEKNLEFLQAVKWGTWWGSKKAFNIEWNTHVVKTTTKLKDSLCHNQHKPID